MIKITKDEAGRIKSGDARFLKEILANHLEFTKNLILDCKREEIEILRGEGRVLREIVKLLP